MFLDTSIKKLVKISCLKHCLFTIIAVLTANIFEPYDASTQLLFKAGELNSAENILFHVFKSFNNYDSLFFIQIADNDYEYEKNHAFFPLYPYMIRYLKKVLSAVSIIDIHPKLMTFFSAYILNFILFILSTIAFYKLSLKVLDDARVSFWSTIFFIFSPASIFFLASYTECLFSLLAFLIGYYFYQGCSFYLDDRNNLRTKIDVPYLFITILVIFLSVLTRSNGLVLVSVPGYFIFRDFLGILLNYYKYSSLGSRLKHLFINIFKGILVIVIALSAYVLVMYMAYKIYCTETDPSILKINPIAPWCLTRFPSVYDHIQVMHWNNGFLKSYTRKNIFNLIVGIPQIVVVGIFLLKFAWKDGLNFITFGLRKSVKNSVSIYNNLRVYPFVIYHASIFVVSAFFALIDCSKRFFSASPLFYWYLAHELLQLKKNENSNKKQKLILGYLFLFNIFGLLLYPTFFVWY
jgi:GPI mannosyltransferase 2